MKLLTFMLTLGGALAVLIYFGQFYDWDARAKRDVAEICKNRGFKKGILFEKAPGKYEFDCQEPIEIKEPGRGLP